MSAGTSLCWKFEIFKNDGELAARGEMVTVKVDHTGKVAALSDEERRILEEVGMSESAGRIILVPTPIGNLGDITLRAIEVLKSADRIACEDTRRSGILLSHHGISGKSLTSLHEHNESRKSPELVAAAKAGEVIAFISDAGMPGVSDPGYRLVQACLEAEVPFEVLPGPSAVLTALIGSGLPCHAFRFGGFLSVKSGKRRTTMNAVIESGETGIFFESPTAFFPP